MKKWKVKIKYSPEDAIAKLEAEMVKLNGFRFNIEKNNKDVYVFKFRRLILYGEKILHYNTSMVIGKLVKTENQNESQLLVSFKEHILVTITKLLFCILAIMGVVAVMLSNIVLLIPGLILLVVVFFIWLWLNKKFERYAEEYKLLLLSIFV